MNINPNSQSKNNFHRSVSRLEQPSTWAEPLFERGEIQSQRLLSITGFVSTPMSSVSEAVDFLSQFILNESIDGDSDGAKSLLPVLRAIEQMNASSTCDRRQQEQQALNYVIDYTEMLKETEAPADVIKGFEKVTEVLHALHNVRSHEVQTGELASYASVEQAHQSMFKETQSARQQQPL